MYFPFENTQIRDIWQNQLYEDTSSKLSTDMSLIFYPSLHDSNNRS